MMRQGVALSRRMISTLLARVLTGFAGILSGAAVLAQAPVVPRPDTQPIDASEVIAAIHTQMLSPLVNTVMPVHNLDGSIDESSPGIESFHWVDGLSDRSYWGEEPGNVHLQPRVHIAPGGFATDDVEGSDQESGSAQESYNSSEEFERFINQPVHVDDDSATAPVEQVAQQPTQDDGRWARPARFQDHIRLVQAVAERYEVLFTDRRDPLTSWEASRKIATLLSTWIVGTLDGTITTKMNVVGYLGGLQSIRELLADSARFHRVVMHAADTFHKSVLPATLIIQRRGQANKERRMVKDWYDAHRAAAEVDRAYAQGVCETKAAEAEAQRRAAPPRPVMIDRPKVEVMLAQPPRVLPTILAAVRVHDREVRTYALLHGFPLRLSRRYQTIVFRDDGTTEVKNSTDVETEALRSQEHRVQDERIQHQMQQLEAQLRRRQAAQSSTIASALVMIERNPREASYDASGSESSEDTGFDLLSTPRDEFGMRIACNSAPANPAALAAPSANAPLHLSDLERRKRRERQRRQDAAAAAVIQKSWRARLQRLSLPGGLERLLGQTDAEPEHVIEKSSSDDDKHYDPNNRLCPDGVPGCTCGSEYNLAWDLNNMWRNHQLGNLTAEAAQVIQQDWKEQRERRQLLLRRNIFHEIRSPAGLLLPLLGNNQAEKDPPLPDGAVG
eukprot:jgi/Chrpa1/21674/Chrysochromulina_OHIO_Genome00025702-RA